MKSNELMIREEAHWQDIRERAAIAAMHAIICAPVADGYNPIPSIKEAAEYAIMQADELVRQLKGE